MNAYLVGGTVSILLKQGKISSHPTRERNDRRCHVRHWIRSGGWVRKDGPILGVCGERSSNPARQTNAARLHSRDVGSNRDAKGRDIFRFSTGARNESRPNRRVSSPASFDAKKTFGNQPKRLAAALDTRELTLPLSPSRIPSARCLA